MKRRLEDIKPYIRRHNAVADLGVGPGYYWSGENTDNCIGVDISCRNIRRVLEHSPTLNTLNKDIRETELPDKTYDLVVISQVIEHFECYLPVIEEAKRICKDDGYFLVAVPVEEYHKLHFWPVWSMEDMIAMGKKFGEILELKKSPDCWLMYIKK